MRIIISLFLVLVVVSGSIFSFRNTGKLQDVKGVSKKEVIGFLPSWSAAQSVKVYPEYFSQIIYFGLGVTEKGDVVTQTLDGTPTFEWQYFNSEYFKQLQKEAGVKGVKILLAIKCFDNETTDNLISNQTAIDNLTVQLSRIISVHNLDGINIDFEYVTDTDFPTSKYLVSFMQSLSSELKKSNPQFILSMDINASAASSDKAYNMTKIGKAVDQVILMAYDYRLQNSKIAGPTAPIAGAADEHSIAESIDALSGRVGNEKLIVAIPLYGYEWQTKTDKYKSAVIEGSGSLASYKRVKDILKDKTGILKHWDETSKSPWLSYVQDDVIKEIYYEDDMSIAEKIRFINERKLGGVGVWALGYDDGEKSIWKDFE